MAAPKSTEENRVERRTEMVKMRSRGLTYGQIAKKFGTSENSVRMVVLAACNQNDPKPFKERLKPTMTKMTQQRINDLEIENAMLRNDQPSLRDQFAMAALTGLLANQKLAHKCLSEGGAVSGWFEENAYAYADAMLEARNAKD